MVNLFNDDSVSFFVSYCDKLFDLFFNLVRIKGLIFKSSDCTAE